MRNITPCPNWRELLSAYQDRELSPKENKRVAAHLETCDDCRAALAQLERDRSRFTAAFAEPAEGVDLRDSILTELRTASPERNKENTVINKLRWLLGGAGAVALVSLILLAAVVMDRQPDQSATIAQRQHSTADILYAKDNDETRYTPKNSMDFFSRSRINDATGSINKPGDPDYGMNAYLYDTNPNTDDTADAPIGRLDNPADVLIGHTGNSYALSGLLKRPGNGVSVHGSAVKNVNEVGLMADSTSAAIKLAYDISYGLQVKDALRQSRKAQEIIGKHGGFTMNYQYIHQENAPAYASFNGKVPAEKAETALKEVEKLGQVRALIISGADLTEQFQQQQAEIKRQQEHADRLDKMERRTTTKTAMNVEEKRNQAKWEIDQAKRTLIGLNTRHELVTISAEFVESQPREPMTLSRATQSTKAMLHFSLLLLTTLGVVLLALGLIAAPIATLRWLRKR